MPEKKKSLTDLRAERAAKVADSKKIIEKAMEEKRELTKEEKGSLTSNDLEIRTLNLEFFEAEAENRRASINSNSEPVSRKASISGIINEMRSNRVSEDTLKYDKRGRAALSGCGLEMAENHIFIPIAEQRDTTVQQVSDPALGGSLVQEEHQAIILPLNDRLILKQLGANIMTGLVGDMVFPKGSAVTADWVGELTANHKTNADFSTLKFKPKAIGAEVYLSNQLLMQVPEVADAYIKREIQRAISVKLQKTLFGKEAATDAKPAGLFETTPTDKGVLTFDRLVDMETTLETNNSLFENPKFLVHPKVKGIAKKTLQKDAVAGYLMENGKMNSYDVLSTNSVATGLQTAGDEAGIIFGDWADYFLGQWGALDLFVDPFTQSSLRQIKVQVTAYYDAGKLRDESFVIASAK